MKNAKGMTIIELLIVLVIFSVVMMGLYSAYSVMMGSGVKEYRLAQSEVELQIAKTVIYRDMSMAGFGLADHYCDAPASDAACISGLTCGASPDDFCVPRAVSAADGTPDTLTLMGTALGRKARASQSWSYTLASNYTTTAGYRSWSDDPREALALDDWIIYIEPNVQRLLATNGAAENNSVTQRYWLFPYPASGVYPNPELEAGVLAFGMQAPPSDPADTAKFPYAIVSYYMGGTCPSVCASGTQSLLRSESTKSTAVSGQPLLNCVLDFQVAFGLDTSEDGIIDCWDNGGSAASGYSSDILKTRLKQIRVFALLQEGARDRDYTYANPDPLYASTPDRIRVGDTLLTACSGGGVGRDYTLSSEQRKYRWRVLAVSVAPRNVK